MAKTFSEVREDLSSLKDDMMSSGRSADSMMLASYLDRLVLAVQDLTETLDAMEATMDQCCEHCDMVVEMSSKPKAMPKPKKVAKKMAKKKRR